jgi:hypothetical protein
MPPAILPATSPASLKGPPVRKKWSPPTIISTNTTTTTTTTTTSTSTQPMREDEQIAEPEQEVRTRRKRLCKHISEDPDDSNLIDFKSIVTQIDDSKDFSSQDLESSLSISTQLVEISDEEMEDEMDSSSQMEELPVPPDYTFSSGLKLSTLWRSIFLYVFLCVCTVFRTDIHICFK